jgi:hypothetical protein
MKITENSFLRKIRQIGGADWSRDIKEIFLDVVSSFKNDSGESLLNNDKKINASFLPELNEITKAQLDALISTESLIPGQLYKVTGVDEDLYGGTDILIKAATTSELELTGHGIFYNPKYLNSIFTPENGYGIYDKYVFYRYISGVNSFGNGVTVTANNGATGKFRTRGAVEYVSGDWSTATSFSAGASSAVITIMSTPISSYSIGDNVIWGGKHWVNKTGNRGTSIDDFTLDSTNWEVIPFNSTDYNVEIDQISYDYQNDLIVSRKDRWNNNISFTKNTIIDYIPIINPIKIFQWGNYPEDNNANAYKAPGVTNNTVVDSTMYCINFTGESLKENIITALGALWVEITDKKSSVIYTKLDGSYFTGNTLIDSYFYGNSYIVLSAFYRNVCMEMYMESNNFDYSNINDNYFEYTAIQYSDFRQSYINQTFFKNGCPFNKDSFPFLHKK